MTALLEFFIPGIAATRAEVEGLAPARVSAASNSPRPMQDPRTRVSYRFTYRVSRFGPMFGCRIKASPGITELLMDRLVALACSAEADGDTELLVGCALGIEAIECAKLQVC